MTMIRRSSLLIVAALACGCADESAEKERAAAARAEQAAKESSEKASAAEASARAASDSAADAASDLAKSLGEKAKSAMGKLDIDFQAAYDKAADKLKDYKDAPEFANGVKGVIATAQQAFENVKTSDAVNAAASKLDELKPKMEELATKAKALPDQAKTVLGPMIDQAKVQLQKLVDKIKAMPDLDQAAKDKFDEFMKKLDDLKG
jgi:hypothetical protein